eukprot:TRINITY_DN1220_c0_g1_i1.p1 TRINITY_DN1220_c0_g1~~TRINITY_DN1220_c0_g1_i1.p1  ORF type:complete len:560 (-),score=122.81 TRINITY_DN1220_c0_g1_i1:1337-3016(-)
MLTGTQGAMIGREKELEELLETYDQILTVLLSPSIGRNSSSSLPTSEITQGGFESEDCYIGVVNTIVVTGQPGFGKSCLLKEFSKRCIDPTLMGSANAMEKNTTYYAWRDIVAELINFSRIAAKLSTQQERGDAVVKYFSRLPSNLKNLAPLISRILPVFIPDNEITSQMAPDLKIEATNEMVVSLLRSSPYRVILMDDCSRLDSASWRLVLLASKKLRHIMIVISLRPHHNIWLSQLLQQDNVHQIKLDELTFEQSVSFVCTRLRVVKLSRELEEVVKTKAQGNPMILEELQSSLKDLGIITLDSNQAIIKQGKEKELQNVLSEINSLAALVNAKIDRLEHAKVVILQLASVIGVTFPLRLLCILVEKQEESLNAEAIQRHLSELVDLKYIFEDAQTHQYTFVNTIVQEVVYNQILFSRKRTVHQLIAEWYEDRADVEGSQTLQSILAHHYKVAENKKKACYYFDKAGQIAANNYANDEAIYLFLGAIEMSKPSTTELSNTLQQEDIRKMVFWERNLGESYYNLGKFEMAKSHLEEALNLLDLSNANIKKKGKQIGAP